jgi:hypothetical protein
MIARWSGDLSSFTLTGLQSTVSNVSNAGVEREMNHQFSCVFNHFLHKEKLWFHSYLRLPEVLISFVSPLAPVENPMYEYHLISHSNIYREGGSAHPTLFGDSFANAGWLGIILPSLWYCFFDHFSVIFRRSASWHMFALLSLVLLVRGSVVYSQFYILIFYFVYTFILLFNTIICQKRY